MSIQDINPLENLIVIDRLEIGPVHVENKRIITPYSVTMGSFSDTTNLIYSYEEKTFDPDDPLFKNIVHIIASQIGINYGLFCKKIVFHGPYDQADHNFIHYMSRNTAREIYLKKFLQPNQFIKSSFEPLSAIKKDNYVNAELVFPDIQDKFLYEPWSDSSTNYAVLLSGGKESLLSYGLLQEIGVNVHPIFINESGRHWFTSLNSYRSFIQDEQLTSRVWTNSDRVFSWMLRHLPFIRKDFFKIRSDDYPIRLWTVAVFLFGALPILKKRKISTLIIGDEFDTTRRLNLQGIRHFDGLYDQSSYFDKSMTRYFKQKGWNTFQCSILRTLSELLTQKILVKRYPSLQQNQMSCHMAQIIGTRVLPCGKCEKCHRIVGMLAAIGADPSKCGYTKEQIDICLKKLPHKTLHQESANTEHVLYLLKKNRIINESVNANAHSEIEKLRFHPQFSPIDSVPMNIRKPLFTILLENANGALEKDNGKWVNFDPLKDL